MIGRDRGLSAFLGPFFRFPFSLSQRKRQRALQSLSQSLTLSHSSSPQSLSRSLRPGLSSFSPSAFLSLPSPPHLRSQRRPPNIPR